MRLEGSDDEPPEVAAAFDALANGEPEAALTAAARIEDAGERALVEARAYLDLAMLSAAGGAVERARAALGEGDADVVELEGELALDRWDLEGAERAFAALASEERDPWILERLALLADHRGDAERSHAMMAEAQRLDPSRPEPIRFSEAEFDVVVEEALASLAPDFARRLENVRLVREPVPFRDLTDPTDIAATPPDILGLFVGPTIHDLAEGSSGELPPTIYVFQRNLERMVGSRDELAEQIRITLFHEIGHLLGLDEDGVAGMGLA